MRKGTKSRWAQAYLERDRIAIGIPQVQRLGNFFIEGPCGTDRSRSVGRQTTNRRQENIR